MIRIGAQLTAADARLSRLSTRITVIVFWGLALTGLAFAIFLLRDVGVKLLDDRHQTLERVSHALEHALAESGNGPDEKLSPLLDKLRREYGIDYATLQFGTAQRIASGIALAHREPLSDKVDYLVPGMHDGYRHAQLQLYFPSLEDAVYNRRAHVLFSLGLGFMVFGVALRLVLSQVLNKPMLAMVTTAQQISRGDTGLRFDGSRDDEFGYLAGFINQAMESLVEQQQQLRGALARIQDSEAELFREKDLAQVTLHSIGDGVITTDRLGAVRYLNAAAQRLIDLAPEDVAGRALPEIMPLLDESNGLAIEHPGVVCLRDGGIVTPGGQTVLQRRDYALIPVTVSAAPIRDRSGEILGAVIAFQDVSESRRLQHELIHQATHDSLTGLYNRREFEAELERAVDCARRYGQEYALCYLDLDQFKLVNDTCGHLAGDQLLRQLSAHLLTLTRKSDIFARLGGDEFGILFRHCGVDRATQAAENLRNAIKEFHFVWNDKTYEVGASIGLVIANKESHSVADLLSAADVACYMAKDAGRNRVHIYHPDDTELTQRRGEMALVNQIGAALAENRLQLFCQPIVATDAAHDTHRHYELLLRMFDTDGTMISPALFIPAAERYNLMGSIDRWVLQTAMEFLCTHHADLPDLAVSINISGQSLCDPHFLNFAVSKLACDCIASERICFEITETAAVANINHARRFITILRGMGCRFALDDFGSGLSSFNYLKTLPVDYLKIDGSFVRHIATSAVDRAMVVAIAQLGRELAIKTVAEFVEDAAIFDELRKIGVDYGQGYWIGKPQPLENLCVQPAMTG